MFFFVGFYQIVVIVVDGGGGSGDCVDRLSEVDMMVKLYWQGFHALKSKILGNN